ncbi:hypothetical protein SAMN06265337_1725 [Hymenobacter gelipurpurascens]|uniref:Uncharacterized protein n=1 Tax=Hymenobacter gelipurpurascens TaxID=89968 RepID=A0A212TLC0_9BACT|nr:hypothetical protein [Hymenobacter gelipurpurascens]SNC66775.1 hypothetical protein SAMN06265337_1725 [Hymenobacter gelipurpurascens]
MKKIQLFSLIKIGDRKFMENLYYNGTIYMNHVSEFVKIEDGNVRGDKHEHLDEQQEINNIVISLKGEDVLRADIGKLQVWNEEPIGNIYSMYMLETVENVEDLIIDSKCKQFGDTAVIILKVDEFYDRVKSNIENKGLKVYSGPVDYIDTNTFFGKWSLFKKPLEYKYQSEFRFVVKRNEISPLVINIGSLKDIAVIIESDKIDQLRFSKK